MNRLERIKALRAQGYGVVALSPDDIDWLIAQAGSRTESVTLTLREAEDLVECFGGEQTDMVVQWFVAATDEETGEPMPAGYYAWCADCPEEGRMPLGPAVARKVAP